MTNVALLVVASVIFSHIISVLGRTSIAEALWEIYLNVSRSSSHQELRDKKKRAFQVYEKRANTSSKDEFAAWAKLDREYNTLKSNIEKLNAALVNEKSRFSTIVKGALFLSTTGLKLFLRVWYRKSPALWLDQTVVTPILPSWMLWLLSMSAPRGSLSVSSWLFIVDSAVTAFQTLAVQVYSLKSREPEKQSVKTK